MAGKEDEFSRRLERAVDNVREVLPIRISSIPRYWCMDRAPGGFDRDALRELTPASVRAVQDGTAELALLESFTKSGLVREIDESLNIKFFVAVRAPLSAERISEVRLQGYIEDSLDRSFAAGDGASPHQLDQ